ncbi:MAG: hypothetical protein J6Y88_02805 [Bacteroidales bacterium]|jgi:hypothetical protein|nr:hypothetical protein [Bacteroidales bacterium]
MKKLFVVIALAILSFSANAQAYIGGAMNFQTAGNNAVVTLRPEIGYAMSQKTAIGAVIGWSNAGAANTFLIAPYYRYGVKNFGPVSFFVDGELQIQARTAGGASTTTFGVGLCPGIAIQASDNWSFVGRIAQIGYYGGTFGINANMSNNWHIGLYYHF